MLKLVPPCVLLVICACAQEFTDLKSEKVFSGYKFTEGISWSPDKFLVFFDVPTNRMLKWVPGGKAEVFRDHTGGAIGSAYDALGRAYICESHNRRVIRLDKKDKVEVLAERWNGKRLNAPNDIVVRKDGHAWFTDPAFGIQQDTRELDFYGVFHLSPKGELDAAVKLKTRPNGIALAPNGRTLYVANSDEHNIRAYDLDKAGETSNGRVVLSGIEGIPDGLRIDEKGNFYVAARDLFIYSPEGKLLHTLEFKEKPSNMAFGDPDLETLYITARSAVYRVRLNVKGAVPY